MYLFDNKYAWLMLYKINFYRILYLFTNLSVVIRVSFIHIDYRSIIIYISDN